MTLTRYLFIVFAIHVVGFSVIIIGIGGVAPLGESKLNTYAVIALGAGAMAMRFRNFAEGVPEEERVNFWSYRSANVVLAAVWLVFAFFALVTFTESV